jgi:hypothetical protein
VATVVARVAPDGDWRSKLDDVCEALDEEQIPPPKRWRSHDRTSRQWSDYLDRAILVKAIEYRLRTASRRRADAGENNVVAE